MTAYEISQKSLYLVNNVSSSWNGIIITVPQRLKTDKAKLFHIAQEHYQELCKSSSPCKIILEANIKYSSSQELVLGLARNMRDLHYRRDFVNMALSPLVEPIDLAIFAM